MLHRWEDATSICKSLGPACLQDCSDQTSASLLPSASGSGALGVRSENAQPAEEEVGEGLDLVIDCFSLYWSLRVGQVCPLSCILWVVELWALEAFQSGVLVCSSLFLDLQLIRVPLALCS